ncbi:MAG: hypothetical protein M3R70_01805 [Actinomycetota bacterium]|nr:hypothetical protein [Actinomycetota bacterium]
MTKPQLAAAGIAASGAVAFALRLPFIWTGIGPDEGGYAYVADRWAQGERLYHLAWVDRPQGLLLVYRALIGIAHEPWAIRLGAVLFGCAITVLLGVIGWLLRGPVTGVAAAAIYSVVGVAPHLDGYTFNAELAASLPATGAVAAALAWRRSRRTSWLLAAGLLGGSALLMKQSGFDGLAVAAAVAIAVPLSWAERLRAFGIVVAGAVVPLGASAIHGALLNWHEYWFAVAGYKIGADSGASSDLTRRYEHFQLTFASARADLWVLGLLAGAGVVIAAARRPQGWWPALVWLVAALAGFNVAALYWGHYYVQLLPPLALLAGFVVQESRVRLLRPVLVAAVVAPVAVFLVQLAAWSPERRKGEINYYGGFEKDRRIAAALRARSRPDEPVYILSSRADIYFLARRHTTYRYIWGHGIHEVHGAMGQLIAMLRAENRPRWVVVYTSPWVVDHSGKIARAIQTHYCLDTVPAGTGKRIYRKCPVHGP